jgi:hypothetical protein
MTDEKKTDGKEGTEAKGSGPWVDWKQTGTCEEAQADGVPCDHTDGQCEICERSALNPPSES